MWNRLLGQWSLQAWDTRALEENVLYFYRRLMQRYFEDEPLIPEGHLSEVRFEDLEARPLETVAQIYRELSLGGFKSARPLIEAHLNSLGEYRKNEYALDAYEIERVRRDWHFTLERWRYDLPEGSAAPRLRLASAA
jgi:hypothetical protein